jgi:ParB/RepB/Spo0J family partition protein
MSPISRNRDLLWVATNKIFPNPKNPRQAASFTPEELDRLRQSIRTHGVLEPLIVMPYDEAEGTYKLIEGERRLRTAMLEDIVELPVVVVDDMAEHDQVVTMFNIHQQRRAWEMAEELTAVKELVDRNGTLTHEQMADELGMSLATFRDRLTVLSMGEKVLSDIATGKLDYTSALRSHQVAQTMSRNRPDVIQTFGNTKAVESKLLAKARARKRGIGQELVQARRDVIDTAHVPDEAVVEYLRAPETSWRQVRQDRQPLENHRRTQELAKRVIEVERELRTFDPVSLNAEQLDELRRRIVGLMVAGQDLEQRIMETLLSRN